MQMEVVSNIQNAYPLIHERLDDLEYSYNDLKKSASVEIDEREVFDHIRDIKDPEHPLSLEQLGVVELDKIRVDNMNNVCYVGYTPTIPHCSMATLIGLAIKVELMRVLPQKFKVEVSIVAGTHAQEIAVNKQLGDKERVAAAIENSYLLDVINECLLLPEEQEPPEHVKEILNGKNVSVNPKVKYMLRHRQPAKSYRRWSEIVNKQEMMGMNILAKI